jgi:hypothetical protein
MKDQARPEKMGSRVMTQEPKIGLLYPGPVIRMRKAAAPISVGSFRRQKWQKARLRQIIMGHDAAGESSPFALSPFPRQNLTPGF